MAYLRGRVMVTHMNIVRNDLWDILTSDQPDMERLYHVLAAHCHASEVELDCLTE